METGKQASDHVQEMLSHTPHHKHRCSAVLMDTWYATKDLMLFIESLEKRFTIARLKTIARSMIRVTTVYRRQDSLDWSFNELKC